jgi:hypothetical protein
MIVTGIAHPPERLRERSPLPSIELVYLAAQALKMYPATHLITSLAPGWEQALAKATLELGIPYTVALPYPGRDSGWPRPTRLLYLDLLARAGEVYMVSDACDENAVLEGHRWRVDRAGLVLALWDYDFQGVTFQVVDYALCSGRQVTNLWQDWQRLFSLRKARPAVQVQKRAIGAQVFESRA